MYVPNIGAPQYKGQTLTAIKGEIDSNTIIVGNTDYPDKINKETQFLNDTLDQMN